MTDTQIAYHKLFDNFQVFENNEIYSLNESFYSPRSSYTGFFYVIEWENGVVKIGSSKNPLSRYKALNGIMTHYASHSIGKILISPEHYNYINSEKYLHKIFDRYRSDKNSELFIVDFDYIVEQIQNNTDTMLSMELYNESKDLILKRQSYESFQKFKSFLYRENEESKCDIKDYIAKQNEVINLQNKVIELQKVAILNFIQIDRKAINAKKEIYNNLFKHCKSQNINISYDDVLCYMIKKYEVDLEYSRTLFRKKHWLDEDDFCEFLGEEVQYSIIDIVFDDRDLSDIFEKIVNSFIADTWNDWNDIELLKES